MCKEPWFSCGLRAQCKRKNYLVERWMCHIIVVLLVAFQIPVRRTTHTLHSNSRYHLASFRFNITTFRWMMPASFNTLLIAAGSFLARHNRLALQVKVKHTTVQRDDDALSLSPCVTLNVEYALHTMHSIHETCKFLAHFSRLLGLSFSLSLSSVGWHLWCSLHLIDL